MINLDYLKRNHNVFPIVIRAFFPLLMYLQTSKCSVNKNFENTTCLELTSLSIDHFIYSVKILKDLGGYWNNCVSTQFCTYFFFYYRYISTTLQNDLVFGLYVMGYIIPSLI